MTTEAEGALTVEDAIASMKRWTPAAQERALDLIKIRSRSNHRPFYCPNAQCDGNPHEGWAWPHARADQRPPSMREFWQTWLYMAGRGAGKSRSASELSHAMSHKVSRMALVAQTGPDGRDTMVEGELSGILATARPGNVPEWEPSKKRLTWPNGCIGIVYSAEEPDRLRGPQNGFAWIDEAAHMPLIEDVWSNLLFTLRLGVAPRVVVTTTPTATKWIKDRVNDPLTRITRVSSDANKSNLSLTYVRTVLDPLRGTRLGRQEIDAEVLADVEGALWKLAMIEANRFNPFVITPESMERIVVAIDPAGTSTRRSDETGIIVLGALNGEVYVFADASGTYSPAGWAGRAVDLYERYQADAIVAEKNYGGEMVESTLRNIDSDLPIRMVTSRRGKAIRATPIVAAYEQRHVHHPIRMDGILPLSKLEDQMTEWIAGSDSPDRVDALVHGATDLIGTSSLMQLASGSYRRR